MQVWNNARGVNDVNYTFKFRWTQNVPLTGSSTNFWLPEEKTSDTAAVNAGNLLQAHRVQEKRTHLNLRKTQGKAVEP